MNGKDRALLERITRNPEVKGGKPVIRGTRLTVSFILEMMAYGRNIPDILAEYDHISREDILACLRYAEREMARNTFLPLGVAEGV